MQQINASNRKDGRTVAHFEDTTSCCIPIIKYLFFHGFCLLFLSFPSRRVDEVYKLDWGCFLLLVVCFIFRLLVVRYLQTQPSWEGKLFECVYRSHFVHI